MHTSISEPGTDNTCDRGGGGGGACGPFTESLPAALPPAALAGGSEATFCLASSSAGQDSAPITAVSPGAAGGGVAFLHGDAPAPTPALPAGSATSVAAPPPTFGSSIADANAPSQDRNQRLPDCRVSIPAAAAAAAEKRETQE